MRPATASTGGQRHTNTAKSSNEEQRRPETSCDGRGKQQLHAGAPSDGNSRQGKGHLPALAPPRHKAMSKACLRMAQGQARSMAREQPCLWMAQARTQWTWAGNNCFGSGDQQLEMAHTAVTDTGRNKYGLSGLGPKLWFDLAQT